MPDDYRSKIEALLSEAELPHTKPKRRASLIAIADRYLALIQHFGNAPTPTPSPQTPLHKR